METLFNLIIIGGTCAGLYKMFEKMGVENWKALIPLYNFYALSQGLRMNPWTILLFIVPLVNIYIWYRFTLEIGKAFGKSGAFLFLIFFLSPIAFCILGFSKDEKFLGTTNESNGQDAKLPE